MQILSSTEGRALMMGMRKAIKAYVCAVDEAIGLEIAPELDDLLNQLKAAREAYSNGCDEILNDIAILEEYVLFFRSYGRLWHEISTGGYSQSWNTLQDAYDSLRLIRRWSKLTLTPLVEQLVALESLYPYKIFASVGWLVERFECNICGNDMDSFNCIHRKNDLYRGTRAIGIARNILQLDHVALVEHPVDKRCVISIPNDAPGFDGLRYLSELLVHRLLTISNFGGVAWGKRMMEDSKYTQLGRNERCFCLSGKKFKNCCIDRRFKETDHAEILPMESVFERSEL